MAKKPKINSNLFIGNNALGSENLFYSRMAYAAYAFNDHPESVEDGVVKDFWFQENAFYGKVDLNFTPIQVDRSQLVPLKNHQGHFTLPFVRDAFEAFEKDVKKCILNGTIRSFPLLKKIKVLDSTRNLPRVISQRMVTFVRYILRELTRSKKIDKIENFKDFMVQFEDLAMQYVEEFALTTSSVVETKAVDLRYSGLALSLADGDYSADPAKVKFYMGHSEFPYYLKLLEKYGFYVDKNAPWRIVANISSAAMQSYLVALGGATGLPPVFARYYKKAQMMDIEILRLSAYRAYSLILITRPKIFRTSIENGRKMTRTIHRSRLERGEMFRVFSLGSWLALYVKIKNKEKNLKFQEADLDDIISDCINLGKRLDIFRVLRYIDIVFKDIPSLEGSYNDFRNRKFYKNLDESQYPFEDYQDYLIETLKKG
tara:strand:+ start:721 stop:2007 length:1287 start_codon:yes stop_codon:yes gene_type:complete